MPIMPAQAPQRLTACRARRARGTRIQVLQISHIVLSIWFHLIPCVNLCGWNFSVLVGKRLQKARGNFASFQNSLYLKECAAANSLKASSCDGFSFAEPPSRSCSFIRQDLVYMCCRQWDNSPTNVTNAQMEPRTSENKEFNSRHQRYRVVWGVLQSQEGNNITDLKTIKDVDVCSTDPLSSFQRLKQRLKLMSLARWAKKQEN